MSKALISKNISSGAKDELAAIYDKVILAVEQARVDEAFTHKYLLTVEQALIAAELFTPMIIKQRTRNLKFASHPVLNILNDYCDHTAAAHLHYLKTKGYKTLSIGDSLNTKVKADHNCILIDSAREAFRVMGQTQAIASTDISKVILQDKAAHNSPTFGACCNGAQRCGFQATHMVGMHSMYNVTLDDLYLMFYKHNAYYFINYMYIPYQIYNAALSGLDAKLYNIHKITHNGRKCFAFSMRDASIPYIHDEENWRVWANWTVFRGPTFTLIKEVSNSIGPMQTQVITRIARDYKGEILATIPFSNWVKRNVLVPDMVYFVEHKCCLKQKELPHIMVPENVVSGILNYAIRAVDGSYQFTDIATLASGLKRELTIGNTQYYEAWNVQQDKYNRSLISLFYLGAIMRAERTSVLSTTFKMLKEQMNPSFFGELGYNLRWYFNRLVLWAEGHFKDRTDYEDAENKDNPIDLDEFRLIYLQDVVINCELHAKIGLDPSLAYGDVDETPVYGLHPADVKKIKDRLTIDVVKDVKNKIKGRLTKYKCKIGDNPGMSRPMSHRAVCSFCGLDLEAFYYPSDGPITITCSCGAETILNDTKTDSSYDSDSSTASATTTTSKSTITTVRSRVGRTTSTSSSSCGKTTKISPVRKISIKTLTTSRSRSRSSSVGDRPQFDDMLWLRKARAERKGEFSRLSSRSNSVKDEPTTKPTPPQPKPVEKLEQSKQETIVRPAVQPKVVQQSLNNTKLIEPSKVESYEVGNCTIELHKGDFASYKNVDAYINASNLQLKLGTGISASLNQRFPALQAEMDKINIAKLAIGNCYVTDSGNGIPIIHAVGPRSSDHSNEDLNNLLDLTYANIDAACTKYKRIAGCLVSAGVFGGNKQRIADLLINTLIKSKGKYTFVLVTIDQTDIDAVRLAIMRNSGRVVKNTNLSVNDTKDEKKTEVDLERAKMPDFSSKSPAMTAIQRSFISSMVSDIEFEQNEILLDPEPPYSTGSSGYRKRQAWEERGTTDLGIANEIACDQIPTSFKNGHCAMQAVYNAYYAVKGNNNKMAIAQILRQVRERIIKMGTPKKYADLYIFRGHWNQGAKGDPFVSSVAIKAMADLLSCNITINLANGKVNKVWSDNDKPINIDIYHKNNHFSATVDGGAKDKYPALITEILDKFPIDRCSHNVYVELSSAPGHLTVLVDNMVEFYKFHKYSLVYRPGLPFEKRYIELMTTSKQDKDRIGTTVIFYDNHDQLAQIIDKIIKDHKGIDYLLSDAAAAVNSEMVIDSLHSKLNEMYKSVNCLIYKTFGNPITTWEYFRHFNEINTYKTGVGSEVYYIGTEYGRSITLNKMYERFHRDVTQHVISNTSEDVYLYARNYFTGEFKKFTPTIPHAKKFTTIFDALTGYASASKTTKAVELYSSPRTIFIAPTKTLSLKHQKMGVRSYTPHVVFSVDKVDVETIIVDELSQFDVRYVHLLKIAFPNAKIVVVGDVYQTRGFSNGKHKTITFNNIGVVNNIWEVYKIPLDIVNMLNERYGFNMIFKGDVENGLKFSNDKNQNVVNLPVGGFDPKDNQMQFIAMNTTTVDELEKRKIKANTVTTYTGSRTHTVVFVVDNRAVASQLVNQREVVYTAMTRATNQLVIYGQEKDMIKTIFKCDNPLLISLQEANDVRIAHENRLKIIENTGVNDVIDKGLDPEVHDDRVVTQPVSKDVAVEILTEQLSTDKPLDVFNVITPSVLPEVEEGVLKVNEDLLADQPKDKYVYKIDENVILVKHQTSDGKLETVRTIISRYAKKNKKINARSTQLLKSDLLDGLAKAIYGENGKISTLLKRLGRNANDKSYKHNLQFHYEEYIKSLQTKINSGSATTADYTGEFEPFDEFLSFFNKNQDKFDPKFDLNKCGQGVAAFSKKVNILFSCYARYILQEIRSECNQGDIYIATHDDEKRINSEITRLMLKHKKKFRRFFNCDISEWDSRFFKAFCELMKELLRAAGLDAVWVDWFYQYRDNWKMSYNTKDGKAKLKGRNKQFSGNPFTILENTICNLALMWTILEIKGFGYAAFKGDDSCIYADSVKFSVKGKRILDMTGHKTKETTTDSGEFAGYMITEAGLFPDVVRYAAKFIGKNYRDEDHFLQAQEGLTERVRSVQSQTQLVYGCAAMSEHYEGLNPQKAHTLFEYLKSAQKLEFSKLRKVKVRTHIASA
jgi:O-acetyl-ADP-ribose deacetylase (regulator of RNase III)